MARRPKRHGRAAFARADVDDAKRGRPAVELRDYATARGLEWVDQAMVAGLSGAQPEFADYQFNVMHGVLGGDRYGILLHELFELPVYAGGELSMQGTFYALFWKTPRWWVPEIVKFFERRRPAAPFENESVWIPCTLAAVHVPEAIAAVPWFAIEQESRHTLLTRRQARDLAPFGLSGCLLRSDPEIGDELARRLLSGRVPEILDDYARGGYMKLEFSYGTLRLWQNGFVAAPEALDRHIGAVAELGRHLADVCLPLTSPRRFDDRLPPKRSWDALELPPIYAKGFVELARRLRLEHEEPLEYHRAFATLPGPGRAVAVMRGVIPGTSRTGRLVYFAGQPVGGTSTVRGAVVMPAADGLEPTPPGGVRLEKQRLVYEIRDGMAVIWSRETWGWRFVDEDTIVERATALARDRGLWA